jgi:hypothetical protein
MASNVRFLDQVPVSAYSTTSALSINTGSFMITGSVDDNNKLTFTKGDGSTFDLQVAASASSADALVTASISASIMTFTKGDASTFDLSLPSSSGGGTDITYNSSASQLINNIVVKDFDTDVTVTYDAGNLTFLFGTPQAPSPALSISGFDTDRFNKVTDNYTVSAPFNLNGYTLISASLFETTGGGNVLLQGPVGSGNTSFSISPTTTGSVSYRLEVTSSNPADDSTSITTATDSGTLSKTNPGAPTIAFTPDVQLGAATNEIELGATGSISFTPSLGSSNGWTYLDSTISTNISSPKTIVYNDDSSILISASADYSSSGFNGSDNDPSLNPTNFSAARPVSSTTTYTRIKSLRYGTSAAASFTEADLLDIESWDTSLGGAIGTIDKGKNTQTEINNQSINITWTGLLYQYVIYDASLPDLTQFDVAGNNYIGAFESPVTVGGYKVWRTTNKQYAASSLTQTYKLIF